MSPLLPPPEPDDAAPFVLLTDTDGILSDAVSADLWMVVLRPPWLEALALLLMMLPADLWLPCDLVLELRECDTCEPPLTLALAAWWCILLVAFVGVFLDGLSCSAVVMGLMVSVSPDPFTKLSDSLTFRLFSTCSCARACASACAWACA